MTKATIRSGSLVATIGARGAELLSVRDAAGHEWMWQGAYPWARSAPVLFPVIGASAGGAIRWQGQSYAMPMHGFAPDAEFTLLGAAPQACTFALFASPETRKHFPFDFELRVVFSVDGTALRQSVKVRNPGATVLPVQIGLHPGFCVPGDGRESPIVVLDEDEAPRVRRLRGGFVCEELPTPLRGRTLSITPSTFDDGGFLIEAVRSSRLWHGRPRSPGVGVAFSGFPQLGLWSKLSANFLCIEPWLGMPDREGAANDLGERSGICHVAPGSAISCECIYTVGASASD